MEQEQRIFEVGQRKILETWMQLRDSSKEELDELRSALKVFEQAVRSKERDLGRLSEIIDDMKAGTTLITATSEPPPDFFAGKSIAQASYEAIGHLHRPMHAKDLVNVLEAGGKKLESARPVVSIASALSRDHRFVKVAPNTFDLVEREEGTEATKEE